MKCCGSERHARICPVCGRDLETDKGVGSYGEGIGGPVQVVEDPNDPSFDPATSTSRDKRISELLTITDLTDWERKFLSEIYGVPRMTQRQSKAFVRICEKYQECMLRVRLTRLAMQYKRQEASHPNSDVEEQ